MSALGKVRSQCPFAPPFTAVAHRIKRLPTTTKRRTSFYSFYPPLFLQQSHQWVNPPSPNFQKGKPFSELLSTSTWIKVEWWKSTCIPAEVHPHKCWHQVGSMHPSSSDTLLCLCYAPRFSKTTMRLKCKTRHMPHHLWSITTCCVLKNERLYLKHGRQVCFSPLFILVHFPWGIAASVSVDTLIEMCEVKTVVYISSRDLCSSIIRLSLFPRDYTGFKGKNGFL